MKLETFKHGQNETDPNKLSWYRLSFPTLRTQRTSIRKLLVKERYVNHGKSGKEEEKKHACPERAD